MKNDAKGAEERPRFNFRAEGAFLEKKALEILVKKGFRFVEANFFTRWGEIDLICLDGKTLVFVEVKARRSLNKGLAEESVTPKKIEGLVKSALFFIQTRGWQETPVRFDVMAKNPAGWTHYPDAFMAEGGWFL